MGLMLLQQLDFRCWVAFFRQHTGNVGIPFHSLFGPSFLSDIRLSLVQVQGFIQIGLLAGINRKLGKQTHKLIRSSICFIFGAKDRAISISLAGDDSFLCAVCALQNAHTLAVTTKMLYMTL